MKNSLILILVITLTYGVGQWLSKPSPEINQIINYSSCDPVKQICKIESKSTSYTLQFSGKPSALTPFLVRIDIQGLQADLIELSFDMDGMDMGFNKHRLVKKNNNWQTSVILPMCSLGRNDWLLNVKMKFKNKAEITVFKFSQEENESG